jgi:hypothetical protein
MTGGQDGKICTSNHRRFFPQGLKASAAEPISLFISFSLSHLRLQQSTLIADRDG